LGAAGHARFVETARVGDAEGMIAVDFEQLDCGGMYGAGWSGAMRLIAQTG
jgi:hypothetical protein